MTGVVGLETITVGGLSVTKQEFGLVDTAAYKGDGVTSGILGLAFPNLTTVHSGTDVMKDNVTNFAHYNPFFFTAVAQKAVSKPFFSFSLNRGSWQAQVNSTFDQNLGYLSFGGMAPVKTMDPVVTVPIQQWHASSGMMYAYYLIDVDSFVFNGSTHSTGSTMQAVLDTGTTVNFLPPAIAEAFNAMFVPPAKYDPSYGLYFVACNATVPSFAVEIAGKEFTVDPKDNILPIDSQSCITGISNSLVNPKNSSIVYNILGEAFLHNVVATFNPIQRDVSIAQRLPY